MSVRKQLYDLYHKTRHRHEPQSPKENYPPIRDASSEMVMRHSKTRDPLHARIFHSC